MVDLANKIAENSVRGMPSTISWNINHVGMDKNKFCGTDPNKDIFGVHC